MHIYVLSPLLTLHYHVSAFIIQLSMYEHVITLLVIFWQSVKSIFLLSCTQPMPPCLYLVLWWHSWLCSRDVITAVCTSLPALPRGCHVFHIQLFGGSTRLHSVFFPSVLVSCLLFSLGPCYLYLLQSRWCWDFPASIHAWQSCYCLLLKVKLCFLVPLATREGALKFHR